MPSRALILEANRVKGASLAWSKAAEKTWQLREIARAIVRNVVWRVNCVANAWTEDTASMQSRGVDEMLQPRHCRLGDATSTEEDRGVAASVLIHGQMSGWIYQHHTAYIHVYTYVECDMAWYGICVHVWIFSKPRLSHRQSTCRRASNTTSHNAKDR